MHNQILTDAQVIDLIHAYGELTPLSGSKDAALVRLTNSIYRMEVTYISKLIKCKSETEVDIQFLANEATFEFLDRYVIRRAIDFVPGMPVLPLLKRIARSKVLNEIRDSRRRCRYPGVGRDKESL